MVLKVKTGKDVQDCEINFPESGMHPSKLFIIARELVWASKFYNIEIATFSPMLIEAIDTWSEYFEITVEFYLNEYEVDPDWLYEIYDDLAETYDKINVLRIRASRKQRYCSCCE